MYYKLSSTATRNTSMFLLPLVLILSGCGTTGAVKDPSSPAVVPIPTDFKGANTAYIECIQTQIIKGQKAGTADNNVLVNKGLSQCRRIGRKVAYILMKEKSTVSQRHHDFNVRNAILPDMEKIIRKEALVSLTKENVK